MSTGTQIISHDFITFFQWNKNVFLSKLAKRNLNFVPTKRNFLDKNSHSQIYRSSDANLLCWRSGHWYNWYKTQSLLFPGGRSQKTDSAQNLMPPFLVSRNTRNLNFLQEAIWTGSKRSRSNYSNRPDTEWQRHHNRRNYNNLMGQQPEWHILLFCTAEISVWSKWTDAQMLKNVSTLLPFFWKLLYRTKAPNQSQSLWFPLTNPCPGGSRLIRTNKTEYFYFFLNLPDFKLSVQNTEIKMWFWKDFEYNSISS